MYTFAYIQQFNIAYYLSFFNPLGAESDSSCPNIFNVWWWNAILVHITLKFLIF